MWHPQKAAIYLEKHGVSFEEASTAFDDPMQLHYPDHAHSIGEVRLLCIGMSAELRLLVISYTERPDDVIRLISAREATKQERKLYGSQRDFA